MLLPSQRTSMFRYFDRIHRQSTLLFFRIEQQLTSRSAYIPYSREWNGLQIPDYNRHTRLVSKRYHIGIDYVYNATSSHKLNNGMQIPFNRHPPWAVDNRHDFASIQCMLIAHTTMCVCVCLRVGVYVLDRHSFQPHRNSDTAHMQMPMYT